MKVTLDKANYAVYFGESFMRSRIDFMTCEINISDEGRMVTSVEDGAMYVTRRGRFTVKNRRDHADSI